MSWTEVIIEIAREHAEALSDALMEAGALSVSVEDADAGTEAEQPVFGEPGMEPTQPGWERSRVVALADAGADHAAIVNEALAAIGLPAGEVRHVLRPVADQDWVRLTQSQFEPIHIGRNIWVVPYQLILCPSMTAPSESPENRVPGAGQSRWPWPWASAHCPGGQTTGHESGSAIWPACYSPPAV